MIQAHRTSKSPRFKPYPEYKDSGVEWLGEIPAHWKVSRLKSIATVQLSNVDKKSVEGQETVRLCNYVDVYYNEIITNSLDFMPSTATKEQVRRFCLKAGDVMITKDSESWTDIAIPAVVAEGLSDVLCGYHLALLRPCDAAIEGKFLARAITAVGTRDQFRVAANGITRFGLTGDVIKSSVFGIPSLFEQITISTFLDRETARIDSLVANKVKLIELLREKRTALITQAVTRGLDPTVPMKDSGVAGIGNIPSHWEVRRIKNISVIRYGLGEPPKYVNDGLPFIRATDIKRGMIEMDAVKRVSSDDVPWSRRPFLIENEILVVRSGAYTGDSAIVTKGVAGCVAGYDMVVTVSQGSAKFLAWVFLSKYMLQGQFHLSRLRAAQPHLNSEELGSFIVLVPPPNEQCTIAAFLDRETARIDSLVAKVRDAIERLKELRTALISAAVTGKIDVREKS